MGNYFDGCKKSENDSRDAQTGSNRMSKNVRSSQNINGITLRNYVLENCGVEGLKSFSKTIDVDNIRIICMIGEGSFAKVYLIEKTGKHSGKKTYYAMKMLNKKELRDKDSFSYVKLEKQIMIDLNHPFLLKLYATFQCAKFLYLVIEFEADGSLFFHLNKHRSFTECEVRFYACEIILALDYLHSFNIIYCDLKPENILLAKDGHIKLSDFGLAKKVAKKSDDKSDPDERAFSLCGTPEYMSPEILN